MTTGSAKPTNITDQILTYIDRDLLGSTEEQSTLPGDDLLSTGLLDSIGVMRLVAFIEQAFQIKISPADVTIENFISAEAIVNYLTTHGLHDDKVNPN